MKNIAFALLFPYLLFCLASCDSRTPKPVDSTPELTVAFMPDIHFHDVYGEFSDHAFDGLPTKTAQGEQSATIRSMRAQLQSTRLFNENYFALIAALDDVVKRNIKYVALPGDFSDDGQPLHMRGLKTILDKYHREYCIEFFAAPGNHDPTKPISHPAGKADYLGNEGKEQPIFSWLHPHCLDKNDEADKSNEVDNNHPVICSDDVQELGYEPIMAILGEHGFYPKESYRYFETPYSDYGDTGYDYSLASQQAQFENRHYEICHQGSGEKYKQENYSDCYHVPDSSYLVEPVTGLWLLAIDANVYQPKKGTKGNPLDAENFISSSDAGYNKVITHKTHLLAWIRDVVLRAQAQNKTLIAFSHFPMQEFYDGSADDVAQLMGEGKFQLNRNPEKNTSKVLADTGLKVHVAGHMHINDTGVYRGDNGNVLFNIQAPSLAAYVPAYKILRVKPNQQIEVETVVLKDVPRFDELFAHYRAEWEYLNSINATDLWNKEVLQAKNYYQFTEWHLRELARLRFLPREWPADLRNFLMAMNGEQLLVLSQLDSLVIAETTFEEIGQLIAAANQNPSFKKAWEDAAKKAEHIAGKQGMVSRDFASWTGQDLSVDFYRLWSADQLALKDIGSQRFAQYKLLAQQFLSIQESMDGNDQGTPGSDYRQKLGNLLKILLQFSGDAPSDHFLLSLDEGEITPLP